MATVVTRTIGTGGDYTTLQSWEDASPANLVTADEIWRGTVFNQELTQTLTISGQTTDATRYVELTTAAGASFMDHVDKATNPLRYNASVGAAITGSAPYGTRVSVTTAHTRISKLQFGTLSPGPTTAVNFNAASTIVENVIIESSGGCTVGGSSGIARNVFLLRINSGGASIGIGNNGSLLNCTAVRPSNHGNATWGIINNYTSITVKNTAIFGVTNFASVSFTGNNNASNGTIGWGTSNQASLTYADQFVTPSDSGGTQDFRLKTGANLIDTGADLTSDGVTTDIIGTTRSGTYDIGAWEVASSGGAVFTPRVIFM